MPFTAFTSAITGQSVSTAWLRQTFGRPRDDWHTLYDEIAAVGPLIGPPLDPAFVSWATQNAVTTPDPDSFTENGHLQATQYGPLNPSPDAWQVVRGSMPTPLATQLAMQERSVCSLMGVAHAAKRLAIFTQRRLDAEDISITSGIWHSDNDFRAVGAYQRFSAFCNIVDVKGCAEHGLDPQTFGLELVDHRNLDYQEYLDIAVEGDEMGTSIASLRAIERAGTIKLPVNRWAILSDAQLHRSGLLPASARPATPPNTLVGALNCEFSFAPGKS